MARATVREAAPQSYRIGELAAKVGMTERTIRTLKDELRESVRIVGAQMN